MSVHPVTNPMPGLPGPYYSAGVPVAGTDAIETLTIGGTPTGGTFTLTKGAFTTAPIAWSATNATLVANIDAALELLPNVGTGNVTTAVGTMTAGIGTITLTFTGPHGKQVVGVLTADGTLLTGTAPTVAVAITTPGVAATARGAGLGALLQDVSSGGVAYTNVGTAQAPTWTAL